MMLSPERSQERDAAIAAMLPHVPFDGWSRRSLRLGLADIGAPADDADLLFPGGAIDMVATFCDLTDRRMADAVGELNIDQMRLPARVRALMALRLRQARPYKEAVRRAVSLLMLPVHARASAACMARTVGAIWHAAGDRSTDFSWYTKRATLAAVVLTTLLFWLADSSEDDAATLAFLDRRLAGVGRIGALRRRAASIVRRPGRTILPGHV
jgi:ubiquinone biosynthesis protein COQ9